ncbi:MAG: hypothetical protein HPY89_01575 [Pelotomaculum sp.]|nr:hypothetical protein [Pelotomaculum sp.]
MNEIMNEMLFKRLLTAGEEEENIEELIAMGYFTRKGGVICRTRKYREETENFISSKKERLYEVIKRHGSAEDIPRVMGEAGISDFITFIFLAEELVADGRLVKDRVKNCVVKE